MGIILPTLYYYQFWVVRKSGW